MIKKSTVTLFLSLGTIILGYWLTKDAPLIVVGKDLVPDSPFWFVGWLGVLGFVWSFVLRSDEKRRRENQLAASQDVSRRKANRERLVRSIECRWSAQTGVPQR